MIITFGAQLRVLEFQLKSLANSECHNIIKYTMVAKLRQNQKFICLLCMEGNHVRWVPCHHGIARPQIADGGDSL
jgi:hypothetical protein